MNTVVLLDVIKRHDRLDHVMCCHAASTVPKESGIAAERWYGLLEIREYNDEMLVRVRNTRSRLGDWTGRWGNADEEHWTKEASDELYHTREMDGTFWMTFQDWMAHFDRLVIADVEAGWDFGGCSFELKKGSNIVAVLESRHDTLTSLTVRQACALKDCVPLRMCLVTADRPYLPVGGSSLTFISRQAVSSPNVHIVPGKYLVLVEVSEDANDFKHKGAVTYYSPSMGITITPASDDDESLKIPREEAGFVLAATSDKSTIGTALKSCLISTT